MDWFDKLTGSTSKESLLADIEKLKAEDVEKILAMNKKIAEWNSKAENANNQIQPIPVPQTNRNSGDNGMRGDDIRGEDGEPRNMPNQGYNRQGQMDENGNSYGGRRRRRSHKLMGGRKSRRGNKRSSKHTGGRKRRGRRTRR